MATAVFVGSDMTRRIHDAPRVIVIERLLSPHLEKKTTWIGGLLEGDQRAHVVANGCPISVLSVDALCPKNDRPLGLVHQLRWDQKVVEEMALHVLHRRLRPFFDQVRFDLLDLDAVRLPIDEP
jgi:hypothetical protein